MCSLVKAKEAVVTYRWKSVDEKNKVAGMQ